MIDENITVSLISFDEEDGYFILCPCCEVYMQPESETLEEITEEVYLCNGCGTWVEVSESNYVEEGIV